MASSLLQSNARRLLQTTNKKAFANIIQRHMAVVTLSDSKDVGKFNEVNSKTILYFTATWCPPCKKIKPIYENLSEKYNENVAFGKIDVDENSDSSVEFDVSAVPTFVFMDKKDVVARFTGADEGKLEDHIKDLESR